MPRIIVGLGNPGKEYVKTRHNAGFVALEAFARLHDFSAFNLEKKFGSEVATGKIGRHKVTLAKPQTFMNESGRAVQALLNFYKLPPTELIVIHDDKDIPLGEYRVQTARGSAGHNGVASIIAALGTNEFSRLRIGIAPRPAADPDRPFDTTDLVLSPFSAAEQKVLTPIFSRVAVELERLIDV